MKKFDVTLGSTTFVGLDAQNLEDAKEKIRELWALSDYGVSQLLITER